MKTNGFERLRPPGPWVDLALILATAAAMLAWSWGTWPDVQIDFGQQLYVSWQIVEGQVLHRDIAWHHGPLSAYLNALLFLIFGVSLRTIVLCNLVFLAILVGLAYRVMLETAGRVAATVGSLVVLTAFAFGQQIFYGNYNFVTPYEHGVLHGIVLSLVALLSLWKYAGGGSLRWIAVAGLATGLVFLTKAELFVAIVSAVGVGLVAILALERRGERPVAPVFLAFLPCAAAPPVVAFGLFSLALPASDALLVILGSWPAVLGSNPSGELFHSRGLGTLDIRDSVLGIAGWLAGYAVAFLPAIGAALMLRDASRFRRGLALVPFLVLAVGIARLAVLWSSAVRPAPLLLAVAALISLLFVYRERHEPTSRPMRVLQLIWIVFALALLAKMPLNTRTHHYGFALAMPAALVIVAALVAWIPAWISRRGGDGGFFRAVALVMLTVAVLGHLETTARRFEPKIHPVAEGSDAFRADSRGRHINRLLGEIERRVAPDETIAVFPDGAMINFLSRRASPSRYTFFAPLALVIYGDQEVLDSFRADPPDFVVLVHKNASEFGFRFFGDGYGEPLMGWIREHYREVAVFGHPPLTDERWGVALLERASPSMGAP